MILLGEARRPRAYFCIADTLAGAAPFGEDLTVVVVGGGERQPVSNPLESQSVQRTSCFFDVRAKIELAAAPARPARAPCVIRYLRVVSVWCEYADFDSTHVL